MKPLVAPPISSVRLTHGFWAERQETNRTVTIPYNMDKCDETGRTDSLRLAWTPDASWKPHPFYDSDISKAVEAAAYSLMSVADAELEARVERYVDLFREAQQPDGYLNSYYSQTGIEKRWTNLKDMHELYCAGHMFEAAVAHFRATGRRSFLDIAVKYADHIDAMFGPPGTSAPDGTPRRSGYPGHEEIELALVKLADATGERRYLDLAAYFVNQRGTQPHFFVQEGERRGVSILSPGDPNADYPAPFAYHQAHIPVREQTIAEGHSVRACYLYAGMADIARETDDSGLLDACRSLFTNIVERRIYITGGIGSHMSGERFTYDYDLPNEVAYTETCASLALVFFASRMLMLELDGRYGDTMERALLNGVLGGISLSGDRFYYSNPLTFHPVAAKLTHIRADEERQSWYGCACCPPNVARTLASLGSYFYGASDDTIAVHLYGASTLSTVVDGHNVTLTQETRYPWDGRIALTVDCDAPVEFTLALRIPEWARDWTISRAHEVKKGYAYVSGTWAPGDAVTLDLPMPVRRTYASAAVRADSWKVAIERGPIVYCVEEADNGTNLASVALPVSSKLTDEYHEELLGGCVVVTGDAVRSDTAGNTLYSSERNRTRVQFTAVPFALRANRTTGEMCVWIAETDQEVS